MVAAGGVVTWVVCRCNPIHHKLNPSPKKLAWIAARYAAITFPLLYLIHAFLEGFYGKGWMASWFFH